MIDAFRLIGMLWLAMILTHGSIAIVLIAVRAAFKAIRPRPKTGH
jgi:hypothetical protein